MGQNSERIEITNRQEFEKLIPLGTYYSGREVVSTTVGVTENASSD